MLWVKIAVNPAATYTGEPAELYAIGDGFANPASTRAVEQSRELAVTMISLVNECEVAVGEVTVHLKQKLKVYPRALVSIAVKPKVGDPAKTTFVWGASAVAQPGTIMEQLEIGQSFC